MYFVYLLKSLADGGYYIGQTENLNGRLKQHNKGKVKSTKRRTPFKLLGYESYETRNKSRYREYELKQSAHKRNHFIKDIINYGDCSSTG